MFSHAGDACIKTKDSALHSIVLSNLAMVQIRLENAKDALKNARNAIEMAQKVYSKKCTEVGKEYTSMELGVY